MSYADLLGLNLMKGIYFMGWAGIMSTSLVSILPMLLVFGLFATSSRASPAAA